MKRVGLSLLCCFCMSASELPWYMKETAMTDDGRLTFLDKSWWPRARALAEGANFTLDLNHDGMLSLEEFSRATFQQPAAGSPQQPGGSTQQPAK